MVFHIKQIQRQRHQLFHQLCLCPRHTCSPRMPWPALPCPVCPELPCPVLLLLCHRRLILAAALHGLFDFTMRVASYRLQPIDWMLPLDMARSCTMALSRLLDVAIMARPPIRVRVMADVSLRSILSAPHRLSTIIHCVGCASTTFGGTCVC